jgi:hypothetical protein
LLPGDSVPPKAICSKRRGQGDWEEIGIPGGSALRETHPLAIRGQPERREDRARLLDGPTEISGDGSRCEPRDGKCVPGPTCEASADPLAFNHEQRDR